MRICSLPLYRPAAPAGCTRSHLQLCAMREGYVPLAQGSHDEGLQASLKSSSLLSAAAGLGSLGSSTGALSAATPVSESRGVAASNSAHNVQPHEHSVLNGTCTAACGEAQAHLPHHQAAPQQCPVRGAEAARHHRRCRSMGAAAAYYAACFEGAPMQAAWPTHVQGTGCYCPG